MRRRPPRGGRGLKLERHGLVNQTTSSRPPRGGRGLKHNTIFEGALSTYVAPHAGGVD